MTRLVQVAPNSRAYRVKTADELYQTEWKLSDAEKDSLNNFALRHWSIHELLAMLELDTANNPTVRLWNVVYSATYKGRDDTWQMLQYLAAKGLDIKDPVNDKYPMFWCSFRAGKLDGQDFAYVIIQEDRKGVKG
jgi:hypothetical protein